MSAEQACVRDDINNNNGNVCMYHTYIVICVDNNNIYGTYMYAWWREKSA
jgi:hypothetical protein